MDVNGATFSSRRGPLGGGALVGEAVGEVVGAVGRAVGARVGAVGRAVGLRVGLGLWVPASASACCARHIHHACPHTSSRSAKGPPQGLHRQGEVAAAPPVLAGNWKGRGGAGVNGTSTRVHRVGTMSFPASPGSRRGSWRHVLRQTVLFGCVLSHAMGLVLVLVLVLVLLHLSLATLSSRGGEGMVRACVWCSNGITILRDRSPVLSLLSPVP